MLTNMQAEIKVYALFMQFLDWNRIHAIHTVHECICIVYAWIDACVHAAMHAQCHISYKQEENRSERIFKILKNYIYLMHFTYHRLFLCSSGGGGGLVVRSKYTSYRPPSPIRFEEGVGPENRDFLRPVISRTIEKGGRECHFRAKKVEIFRAHLF